MQEPKVDRRVSPTGRKHKVGLAGANKDNNFPHPLPVEETPVLASLSHQTFSSLPPHRSRGHTSQEYESLDLRQSSHTGDDNSDSMQADSEDVLASSTRSEGSIRRSSKLEVLLKKQMANGGPPGKSESRKMAGNRDDIDGHQRDFQPVRGSESDLSSRVSGRQSACSERELSEYFDRTPHGSRRGSDRVRGENRLDDVGVQQHTGSYQYAENDHELESALQSAGRNRPSSRNNDDRGLAHSDTQDYGQDPCSQSAERPYSRSSSRSMRDAVDGSGSQQDAMDYRRSPMLGRRSLDFESDADSWQKDLRSQRYSSLGSLPTSGGQGRSQSPDRRSMTPDPAHQHSQPVLKSALVTSRMTPLGSSESRGGHGHVPVMADHEYASQLQQVSFKMF